MQKELIRTCFDNAAHTYDSVADIQKLSSEILINLIDTSNVTSILDIGCGTGNTSLELYKKYPNASYTLCDLSKNMLRITNEKFPKNAERICADAETYNFLRRYDLAVSNLSMQWFNHPSKFIEKIKKHCDMFAFSILTSESFKSYSEHFKYPPTFNYPSVEELSKIHGLKKHTRKRYAIEFKSLFGAAKYFKKLGACLKSHNQPTEPTTDDSPITLEYDIFFGII